MAKQLVYDLIAEKEAQQAQFGGGPRGWGRGGGGPGGPGGFGGPEEFDNQGVSKKVVYSDFH